MIDNLGCEVCSEGGDAATRFSIKKRGREMEGFQEKGFERQEGGRFTIIAIPYRYFREGEGGYDQLDDDLYLFV